MRIKIIRNTSQEGFKIFKRCIAKELITDPNKKPVLLHFKFDEIQTEEEIETSKTLKGEIVFRVTNYKLDTYEIKISIKHTKSDIILESNRVRGNIYVEFPWSNSIITNNFIQQTRDQEVTEKDINYINSIINNININKLIYKYV